MTADLHIHSEYPLQAYNTLSVPAYAEQYCEITADKQWPLLLDFLRKQAHLPLLFLGGGSNLILPKQVPGLVVKIATQGKNILSETESEIVIRFAAGENWHDTVMWSVKNQYCGIENLALIPGSIGAAPIQNIGAYGVELMDCCVQVEGYELSNGVLRTLSKHACAFAYRDSIFKHTLKDRFVITHVTLAFKKWVNPQSYNFQTDYPALKQYLAESDEKNLRPQDIANAVIAIRNSKLPDPATIPNAGSFFKNPIVDSHTYRHIKQLYPDLVAYPVANKQYKLAAGWLLDKAGWKGKLVEGIAMHKDQALVLTNPNKCEGRKIIEFAQQVQLDIKTRFGVLLEIEPRSYL